MNSKFKKRIIVFLAMIITVLTTSLIMGETSDPEYKDFSQLKGKTVSMLTGAPFEELVKSKADVGNITYFSSMPDMLMALKAGKTDAYFMNNAVAELAVNSDKDIALFPESLGDTAYGFAFPKDKDYLKDWQDAFNQISDEEKDALWKKWVGNDDSIKNVPDQDWPGKNGTVKVGACDTLQPMSYMGKNGKLQGFDVELVLIMAKTLDVHVEFVGMEFSSLMTSVQSGKTLFGIGSIVITDERKELVDFIEYYPASYVLVVRADDYEIQKENIFKRVKDSFHRTFIKDNRYKTVLSGLGLTILIAVVSGIVGGFLGFVLVYIRHKNNKIINAIIKTYSALIAGIPAVVILMVLYYVVLGSVDISAVFVAILGFSLIFAARAYTVIWNAVNNIDNGQMEAALALGYSKDKAFREIILPQSKRIYWPLLQSQFVMLVKETSIAGYITVLELTRAGDLIRSRTMEAFFPLISIAIIYFVLTWLCLRILKFVDKQALKKHEARKIKGVD